MAAATVVTFALRGAISVEIGRAKACLEMMPTRRARAVVNIVRVCILKMWTYRLFLIAR